MSLIRHSFEEQALGLHQFVEAIVRSGTYDADRIVAFIGGVVDLFFEILRSQRERSSFDQMPGTVNWAQVMNHFIECPEIAMFEGSEGGILGTKVASSTAKQPTVQRNNFVDRAKHQSCGIEKIYWNNYVDALVTVEGNETVSFFSPHAPGLDAPVAQLTPHLGPEFYGEGDKPLYHVQAVAWDEEMQDLAVVLSNRMLIMWRLRNREKCQWQQKRELRFDAVRREVRGIEKAPTWDLRIVTIDAMTGEDVHAGKRTVPETESAMRKSLADARLASEAAAQLDIWWNQYLKCWITTDDKGQLFIWDLRALEGAFLEPFVSPKKVLKEHSKLVTSHLELNRNKFTTCSLDRSVILWDHRNLTPEIRLEGTGAHSASVLSQAYLPRFNSLVTVACEKKVFVWTIDSTAYRGMKGKLSGHQANVMRVSAGQKVFFTLDEAYNGILWDGATLASLQTVSCATLVPRHCTCVPEHGTICLSGRRLNFVEGNEAAAEKLGKPLSKEQQAKTLNKLKEGASLKETAAPKYCGLAESRATILSATEVEVRIHARGNPGLSRALFRSPEGETISAFAASDTLSCAVFGTSKGAIHFVKYRSGFAMKTYPGKREGEDWQGPSGAADGAGENEDADKKKKPARGRFGTGNSVPVCEVGRGSSPTAAGNRSPQSAAAKGPAGAAAVAASTAGGDLPPVVGDEEPASAPAVEARRPQKGDELAQRTAPTPEEATKGLSSNVTCVLMCEEQGRVFVGTHEGQVLVFTTGGGFPVLRWLNMPEGPGAVTCLSCGPKDVGLLAVGTQGGSVHLYGLSNFRLAGSVNVGRLLFEGDAAQQGAGLRHARLFEVAADQDLPLTLLTVDAMSRFRLWCLDIHENSGKLKDIRLVLDGGQLREVDCVPAGSRPKQRDRKKKYPSSKKVDMEKVGKGQQEDGTSATSAKGAANPFQEEEATGAVRFVLERSLSTDYVQITALTTIAGSVQLPLRALARQSAEGPVSVDSKVDCGPEKAAELAAALDPKRVKEKEALAEKAVFLTAIGHEGASPRAGGGAGGLVFQGFDEDAPDPAPEFSGSGTDGDTDELVGRRIWHRPLSPKPPLPPAGVSADEFAAANTPGVCDGGRLLWIADTGGWIWCLDMVDTMQEAAIRGPPIAVIVDTHGATMGRTSTKRDKAGVSRVSLKVPTTATGLGTMVRRGLHDEDSGPTLARPLSSIQVQPDAFKVVGAWPAHLTAVQSLVPVSGPSALVSCDTAKEVKVWSTSGDLWGHFSLRSVDGARAPVAIWPPPHVLAKQVSLMRSSKNLCRRMGFHTNREDEIKVLEERRREAKKAQAERLARQQRGETMGSENSLRDRSYTTATISPAVGSRSRLPTEAAIVEDLGLGGETPTAEVRRPLMKLQRQGGARSRAESSGAGSAEAGASPDDGGSAFHLPASAGDAAAAAAAAANGGEGDRGDDDGGSQAGDQSPSAGGARNALLRKKKRFTQEQLGDMLKGHAFSSGCQTYKQFLRKVKSEGTLAKPSHTDQGSGRHQPGAAVDAAKLSRHQLGRPGSAGSMRASKSVTSLPSIEKGGSGGMAAMAATGGIGGRHRSSKTLL